MSRKLYLGLPADNPGTSFLTVLPPMTECYAWLRWSDARASSYEKTFYRQDDIMAEIAPASLEGISVYDEAAIMRVQTRMTSHIRFQGFIPKELKAAIKEEQRRVRKETTMALSDYQDEYARPLCVIHRPLDLGEIKIIGRVGDNHALFWAEEMPSLQATEMPLPLRMPTQAQLAALKGPKLNRGIWEWGNG